MEPIVEVKRADLAYLVKVADWAAGQGFCGIEGIEGPDEWCYRHWDDTRPDGYSADALADYLSTPSPDLKADNAALVDEITRLRSLLIDSGSPPWEDARAILVAELRKAGFNGAAYHVAEGEGCNIPSHIALNLIAHSRQHRSAEHV